MLGVSEVDEDWQKKPVKTLSGGDYLTFQRHKQAQSDKRTGRTPSKNPILLRKSALKNICLTGSSAHTLCKQFGPKSGQTES